MSDPVSNVEIEDVLSSIRRLVSADSRKPQPRDDGPVPAEEDKLVLTPSLRVDAPQPDPGQVDMSAPEEPVDNGSDGAPPQPWQDDESTTEISADDDAATMEDLARADGDSAALPDDLSGDEGEATMFHTSRQGVEAQPLDEDAADEIDMAEELSDGWERGDAASASPWHDDAGMSSTLQEDEDEVPGFAAPNEAPIGLKARIAEVEAAVAARDDLWDPDGESADDYSGGPVSPLPWGEHGERDALPETSPEPPDQPEMPAPETPDPQQTGIGEESVIEDTVTSAPEPRDPAEDDSDVDLTAPGAGPAGEWFADDAVLDEDALRDLVSDIVRQELQGALGERITRNVRKLVRREIHRALTTQDFD